MNVENPVNPLSALPKINNININIKEVKNTYCIPSRPMVKII